MTAFLYDLNLYDIHIQIFKNKYMYIFSRNNLTYIFFANPTFISMAYQMKTTKSFMVHSVTQLQKFRSGFPFSPILPMTIPKHTEKTTRPRMFDWPVCPLEGSYVTVSVNRERCHICKFCIYTHPEYSKFTIWQNLWLPSLFQ